MRWYREEKRSRQHSEHGRAVDNEQQEGFEMREKSSCHERFGRGYFAASKWQ